MEVDKMETWGENSIMKSDSELTDAGRLIKAELEKKGLSQEKLAALLGRTGPWLSRLMHDKRKLTVQTLIDIARILNLKITLPISEDSKNPDPPKVGLDEYIENIVDKRTDERTRMIVREEIERAKQSNEPKE